MLILHAGGAIKDTISIFVGTIQDSIVKEKYYTCLTSHIDMTDFSQAGGELVSNVPYRAGLYVFGSDGRRAVGQWH